MRVPRVGNGRGVAMRLHMLVAACCTERRPGDTRAGAGDAPRRAPAHIIETEGRAAAQIGNIEGG